MFLYTTNPNERLASNGRASCLPSELARQLLGGRSVVPIHPHSPFIQDGRSVVPIHPHSPFSQEVLYTCNAYKTCKSAWQVSLLNN